MGSGRAPRLGTTEWLLRPASTLAPGQEKVQITLTLTKEEFALLDRSREVISHSGNVPKNAEVVVQGLKDLLKQRDPLVKAERAKQRQQKKAQEHGPSEPNPELNTDPSPNSNIVPEDRVVPGRTTLPPTVVSEGAVTPKPEDTGKKLWSAIPMAVRPGCLVLGPNNQDALPWTLPKD